MKKANIIRTIFWGFITLLLIVSGSIGLMYNNKIFNERKDDIEKIISNFNNSEVIKNYKTVNSNIEAELDGKNIKITYNGVETKEYIFKLKNSYLETNIDEYDSIGKIIIMVLTDSITMNNGYIEGSTYDLFKKDIVLYYKLKDGIEYKLKNEIYTVKISLNNVLTPPNNNSDNTDTNIIENED